MSPTNSTKGFWRYGTSRVGWSAKTRPPSLVQRWGGAALHLLGGAAYLHKRHGVAKEDPPARS